MNITNPPRIALVIFAIFFLLSPAFTLAEDINPSGQAYEQIEEYMDQIRYFQGLQFISQNQLAQASVQTELKILSDEFSEFALSLAEQQGLSQRDLNKVEELTKQCFEALELLKS
jgi:hypothetical protein